MPIRTGGGGVVVPPRPPGPPRPPAINFQDLQPDITLPPRLGHPPTAKDLIIKKGFDGQTPDQAVATITANLTTKLAPENTALVQNTARDRFRDFNVALNNIYTPNTPNRKFLDGLNATSITVLGSMSSLQPVVYQVTTAGSDVPRFYARDASGAFSETKVRGNVVMSAALRLNPPGINMSYPKWANSGLSGTITTITEL